MAAPFPRGAEPAMVSEVEPFYWPLTGTLLLPYGAREDGVALKGILIQAQEGQSVLAVSDGIVSYVDEALRGYGKTVIVDHAGDFSSVTARVSEILVQRGQSVRQGQPMARVGRAGKGNFPQLYFELRKNGKAEDPMKYLEKVGHVQ